MKFEKIGFIGLGLIGGSLAKKSGSLNQPHKYMRQPDMPVLSHLHMIWAYVRIRHHLRCQILRTVT